MLLYFRDPYRLVAIFQLALMVVIIALWLRLATDDLTTGRFSLSPTNIVGESGLPVSPRSLPLAAFFRCIFHLPASRRPPHRLSRCLHACQSATAASPAACPLASLSLPVPSLLRYNGVVVRKHTRDSSRYGVKRRYKGCLACPLA